MILPYEYPLCSNKCENKLLFRILASYDINNLLYLKNHYSIKVFKEDTRKNIIYKIIQEFNKTTLPTINHLSHLSTLFLIILINAYTYHLSYQSIP